MAKYTKDNIKVLSIIEAVRKRPGMYVGSTEDPTSLLNELLDNAVDEAMNDYASSITIAFDSKTGVYSVSDNGRGIPIGEKKIKGMTKSQPVPVILATVPHSGGKFDSNAYKKSSGLHGVGLVAVNALSSKFTIEIVTTKYKKHTLHCFSFEKGIYKGVTKTKIKEKLFSTKVSFKPDVNIFKKLVINNDVFIKRLEVISAFLEKVDITYNNQQINKSLNDIFNERLLDNKEPLFNPIIVSASDEKTGKELKVMFTICDDFKRKSVGAVNLLNTSAGTHVNAVTNLIAKVLQKLAKKKKITIDKADTTIGLRLFVSAFLPEKVLAFSSQTKEKLTTRQEEFSLLLTDLEQKIINVFVNLENLDSILARIRAYRLKLKHSDVLKTKKKRGIVSINDTLTDCSGDKGELYLVEGLSAAESIKVARNPVKHAILPLKGKTLNVADASLQKVLANKELANLVKALGIGVDGEYDKLKYEKIIIATDADIDGAHITVLLLGFFLRMYPELLHKGIVHVLLAPLYKVTTKDNKMYPAWTLEEVENYRKKYKITDIRRYKGLGEMNPEEVKEFLLKSNVRKLITIKGYEDRKYLLNLLIKPEARKTLLGLDQL